MDTAVWVTPAVSDKRAPRPPSRHGGSSASDHDNEMRRFSPVTAHWLLQCTVCNLVACAVQSDNQWKPLLVFHQQCLFWRRFLVEYMIISYLVMYWGISWIKMPALRSCEERTMCFITTLPWLLSTVKTPYFYICWMMCLYVWVVKNFDLAAAMYQLSAN